MTKNNKEADKSPIEDKIEEEIEKNVECCSHRRSPNFGKIFLGIIIVAVGLAYFLNNSGLYQVDINLGFNIIWPVILIYIGLSVLSGKGWFSYLIGILLVALILVIMFTNLLINNNSLSSTKDDFSYAKEVTTQEATLDIKTGTVTFNLSGGSDKLVEGTFESSSSTLSKSNNLSTTSQEVTLNSVSSWNFFNFSPKNKMDVEVLNDLPYSIIIDSGASDMNIDLKDAIVNDLKIKTGASDLDLKFSDKSPLATFDLNAGASSVKIKLPKSVGAKVQVTSGVSSKTLDNFTQKGDYYYSNNYDTATNKIEMDLTLGASSLNISWY